MSVHFNLKRLRPNLDGLGFLIDVGMILLVIANLSLILFDWIYRVEAVQSAMDVPSRLALSATVARYVGCAGGELKNRDENDFSI